MESLLEDEQHGYLSFYLHSKGSVLISRALMKRNENQGNSLQT